MNGKSLDITAEKLAQLKALFPEVFSEDKIDFQRLKQVLGEENMVKGEHYQLSWAGKSEARKEIQRQTTATLVRSEELGIRGEELGFLPLIPTPLTPTPLTPEPSTLTKPLTKQLILRENDYKILSGLDSLAESHAIDKKDLYLYAIISQRGDIWTDFTDEKGRRFYPVEYSRRARPQLNRGIYPIFGDSQRLISRIGNAIDTIQRTEFPKGGGIRQFVERLRGDKQITQWLIEIVEELGFRDEELGLGLELGIRGEELGISPLAPESSPLIKPLTPNPSPLITSHFFIEGENLEVLRILQKSYFGKVKMIYIDPPYNTGNDSFVYPDDYSEKQDQYKKRTNSTNEEGFLNKQDLWKKNTKENGQFHSVWLSMMYVRLYLSKNLLRDDGVIFISIDDAEQANLKLLCDEIFGEENFLGDIIWNSTKSVTNTALISVSHTYNLCYFKNLEYFKKNRTEFRLPETGEGFANPDKDIRGVWKADPFQVGGWRPNQQYEITNPNTGVVYKPNVGCSWKNDFETFKKLIEDNRIIFGVGGEAGPQRKRFLSEAEQRGKVSKTLWTDLDTTSNATIDLKELMQQAGLFDNPKPCSLIKRFLQLGTKSDQNHIVLDFFAGSGTTAQAVLELNEEDGGNRQFICVQMPEPTQENTQAYKAGYKTIAEITKARISKVIAKTKQTLRPAVLSYRLAPSNFKIWCTDVQDKEAIAKQLFALKDTPISPKPTQLDLFTELCLKNGLGLGVSHKVENGFYKVDTSPIISYSLPLIWCCFEPFSSEMKNEIWQHKPQKIIFLNSCFTNDAELLNFKTEFSFLTIELV